MNHRFLLEFVCSVCAVSAEEDAQTFSINIDSCLMISVHQVVAVGALVLTVIECELIVDIPTLRAFLAGREPPVHLDKMATLSLRLVSKHPYKVAPSVVTGRFAKMESSFDSSLSALGACIIYGSKISPFRFRYVSDPLKLVYA